MLMCFHDCKLVGHTPGANCDLSLSCLATSSSERTLSTYRSRLIDLHHSDRLYNDRAEDMYLMISGSSVIRSLDPIRARELVTEVNLSYRILFEGNVGNIEGRIPYFLFTAVYSRLIRPDIAASAIHNEENVPSHGPLK